MSPEKEEHLVAICPELFPKHPELTSIYLFGFECGDGWFDLLKELIEQLKAILEDRKTRVDEDEDFPMTVSQVKEKYGMLRFYMSCSTDPVEEAIEAAERKSGKTCESCGELGSMRERNRWYMVRCDQCFNANCA